TVDLRLWNRPEHVVRLHVRRRRRVVQLDAVEEDALAHTGQREPPPFLAGELALTLVEQEVDRTGVEAGQLAGVHRVVGARLRGTGAQHVDIRNRLRRTAGADVRLRPQQIDVGEPPQRAVSVSGKGVRVRARLV